MFTTALILDKFYERHRTAPGHPEAPGRMTVIREALATLPGPQILRSRRAEISQITLCHDPDYVESTLVKIQEGAHELAGGDVSVSSESGEVALHATGGVLTAVDAVLAGQARNAFCAVRPPGHHARPRAAMGFCLFNSIAIAARYAQKFHGLDRVAIVDWDVHHGNGTQEIFYRDSSVLFFSTHQSPWYPGTGFREETGDGPGRGTTLNCPLPAGSGGAEIFSAFQDRLLPALRKFRPELILLSAGFDSRAGDPLGQFLLTDADFHDLTHLLRDAAAELCHERLVSVLEGGYHPAGLASAVKTHVTALLE